MSAATKPPIGVQSSGKGRKPLSKYMKEIIRRQLVELIHKYDIHQKTKRIEALKTMRKHLASRFLKLYSHFRHKKFGEPLQEIGRAHV